MFSLSSTSALQNKASASAFGFSVAQIILVALFPILAETLNLSLATLIACFSLGSFLFLIGGPFWSQQSETYGRQRVLTVGVFALVVSFGLIVYLVFNPFSKESNFAWMNIGILILSRAIYGLIASALVPVAQAIQADSQTEDKSTESMRRHSMSLSFGRVVGVAALVVLSEYYKILMLICFLGLLFLGVYSLVGQSTLHQDKVSKNKLNSAMLNSKWLIEATAVKWILCIAFVFAGFVELLNSSLAGVIKQNFKYDSLVASALTAKILFVASVGIFLVQAFGKAFFKLPWLLAVYSGVLCLAVGSMAFARMHSELELWAAVVFLIMGIGLLPPLYMSVLRTSSEQNVNYGQRAGLMGSAHTLGYAVGSGLAAFAFKFEISIGFILVTFAVCIGAFSFLQFRSTSQFRLKRLL